jgi:hypothetical protein
MAQPRPLEIYWIDVEGGAATLILTPAGESLLIDGGDYKDRDASRVYNVATKVAGLKEIDHCVATHWHSDHYGGIIKVGKLISIKHFYDHGDVPSSPPEDPSLRVLMPLYQQLTKGGSQVLKPGDLLPLKQASQAPSLVVQCLASDGKFIALKKPGSPPNEVCKKKKSGQPDPGENGKSVVLKLRYGRFTFLDAGDLTWNMEEQLVCPVNRVGKIDLFQIDHHGLDLSNNPVLIESICPRVVVVNNGPNKGADPNTMKTLKGLACIQTIWQGHRNVRTGPELNTDPRFIANSEVDCKAEFIKATVQPDGKFSLQIGESGTREEYARR